MQYDFPGMLGSQLDEISKSRFVVSLKAKPETEVIGDRVYLDFQENGICFSAALNRRVRTIQFFAEGFQDYRQFSGILPEGISFSDSQAAIKLRLGQPTANGGGKVSSSSEKIAKWDRFDREHFSLHIQYSLDNKSIDLVTLTAADAVRR